MPLGLGRGFITSADFWFYGPAPFSGTVIRDQRFSTGLGVNEQGLGGLVEVEGVPYFTGTDTDRMYSYDIHAQTSTARTPNIGESPTGLAIEVRRDFASTPPRLWMTTSSESLRVNIGDYRTAAGTVSFSREGRPRQLGLSQSRFRGVAVTFAHGINILGAAPVELYADPGGARPGRSFSQPRKEGSTGFGINELDPIGLVLNPDTFEVYTIGRLRLVRGTRQLNLLRLRLSNGRYPDTAEIVTSPVNFGLPRSTRYGVDFGDSSDGGGSPPRGLGRFEGQFYLADSSGKFYRFFF